MRLIHLDAETYYDSDYSLSKMTTEAYVRDARFELIGMSVSVDGKPPVWLEESQWRAFARSIDWSEVCCTAHHAQFDGLILSHHYGVYPGRWLDTLSMSRAIHGSTIGNGLEALLIHYGLKPKGDYVAQAKGKHRADFTPEEYAAYGAYSNNDNAGHQGLLRIFIPQFNRDELDLMDLTIRWFTEPALVCNETVLATALVNELTRKQELMTACGLDDKALGSDDRLAEAFRMLGVEPPRKVTPAGNEKYAFAKSDPEFQALVESPDDDIRILAESRLAVKSTLNLSRTKRFINMARNGRPCPVYIKYAAAHTWRWGGGDSMNWQNLERTNKKNPKKGMIRKAIEAPDGMLLVVGDQAQVEARKNAWLAGHHEKLYAFVDNRDIYSEFASVLYRRPVDRKANPDDEIPGHVGKTCLATGTRVFTSRGIIPIECLNATDLVWDGVEWVSHGGVLDNGVQSVESHRGLTATPDHEVLTEHGWVEWGAVLTSPFLFDSALDSASLPFYDGIATLVAAGAATGTTRSADARVAGKGLCPGKAFAMDGQPDVTAALKSPQAPSATGATSQLSLTTNIARGFSIVSAQQLLAAITRTTKHISTTAVAAFRSVLNGSRIAARFFDMSRLSPAGMTQRSVWIGSTTTGTTSPATFASLPTARTPAISGGSMFFNQELESWKGKSRVYDVTNAGPRRRFTVLTDAGPVIVHNCELGLGFGMGWYKLSGEMLKGAQGGPPVRFTSDDLDTLEIDPSRFLANPKNLEKIKAMPSRLDLTERLVHCAVSNHIVQVWRSRNAPIVKLWEFGDHVIDRMYRKELGPVYYLGIMEVVEEGLRLPNGMLLRYRHIQKTEGGDYTYLSGRNTRTKLYGGLLTENVVQALCRIIIAENMLRLNREYHRGIMGGRSRIVCSIHDEIMNVAPEREAHECLATMLQIMKEPPSWAPGLPLKAEGGVGRVYGDIK